MHLIANNGFTTEHLKDYLDWTNNASKTLSSQCVETFCFTPKLVQTSNRDEIFSNLQYLTTA